MNLLQCKKLITLLYCSAVDLFCADLSIDPESVGTIWHVLQTMSLALTVSIYYTGGWNTSTLCNKGKQRDTFFKILWNSFTTCSFIRRISSWFTIYLQQLSHICIKLEILITDTCIRIRNEITSFLKTVNQQWRTNCKILHVEVANIDASCRENSSHDPVAVFTKYIRSYEKCYDLSLLNRKIKL